jgi:hypothetical protein
MSSGSHDQKKHAYLYAHVKKVSHYNRSYYHAAYNDSHAMFASSSAFVHGRSRPRRNYTASHASRTVCNGPTTVYHACDTCCHARIQK